MTDTPALTAEERADALADALLDAGKVPILTRDARALIASAIREAEDAAYERAAQLPIMKHYEATAIRKLKSQKETP